MRRGKQSTYDKIKSTTGQDPFKLLNSDRFGNVKDLEAAAEKLSELTGEQITVKPLTLEKMIRKGLEDNQIVKSDSCVSWVDLEPKMKRGKASLCELLEQHFDDGRNIWTIFKEEFSEITSFEDAVKHIEKITGGKISVKLSTVVRTVKKGLDNEEIIKDDHCVSWLGLDKPKKPRKMPEGCKRITIRERIEKKIGNGRSLWDIFREDFTEVKSLAQAMERIEDLTQIKTSSSTVQNTIERGLEQKEITSDEFFTNWYTIRGPQKNNNEEKISEAPTIAVSIQCRECGIKFKEAMPISKDMDFCIKCRRCKACNKWGTFLVGGIYEGIPFVKAQVPNKDGREIEQFVDGNIKPIENPFEEVKINA